MRRFAVLAALACAAAASADTVDLKFLGSGAGTTVKLAGTVKSGDVIARELRYEFKNGTGAAAAWTGNHTIFCSELTEFTDGSFRKYDVKDVKDLPSSISGGMGATAADAIRKLYTAAAGAQFGDDTKSAAFQLAIWELVYDYGTGSAAPDLDTGGIKLNSTWASGNAGIVNQAKSWLSAAHTGSYTYAPLVGLYNNGYQDHIFLIPLPAPLAMGLAGLAGVLVIRRLRPR